MSVATQGIDPVAQLGVPVARRLWSPANTVIALATGLTVVVFAIFAFLCWQGYSSTIHSAETRAQTAADIVADNVHWALAAGLSGLKFVAAVGPDALDPANKPELDKAFADLPADTKFGLYDTAGSPIGALPPGLPADLGTEGFFSALSSGTDWVIAPQSLDGISGEPVILLAQRLGGDSFSGLAVLSMPVAILQSFWEPQNLGAESTVNVHLDSGLMVGRYPILKEPFDVSKSASWPMIEGADSGTYTARSPIDGVTRVVGFRHVSDLGIVVFATISQDTILAGLWSAIIIVLWLMVPIALALMVGSLITASILRRSERTQANLAAAVAHNDVLFREIHHRVKNNLQSVASLLQMQPIAKEIKQDMGQRIAAMSAVHEHIYRSNNFETVRVKDYLQTLADNIRAGADPRLKLEVQLEDLSVDRDAATPLGLILNEVVSNAFKHAFADGRDGVVSVVLERNGLGAARLIVRDNGVGFDPEAPSKGIGRRLIKALTQQLKGQSGFSSDNGSQFTLTFPLAE